MFERIRPAQRESLGKESLRMYLLPDGVQDEHVLILNTVHKEQPQRYLIANGAYPFWTLKPDICADIDLE